MSKLNSQPLGTFTFPKDYDVVRVETLNKTDLTGGNNKYYLIEAHASKDGKKFRLYSRYGRVGHHGTEEERIPEQHRPSLDAAFESLFAEKTSPRKGYVPVKVAQSKMGSAVAQTMVLSDDVKKDKIITTGGNGAGVAAIQLHTTVEKLVTRLYAEAGQAVRNQLSGTLQTSAENPLGTLTLTQIDEGRRILQEAQALLTKKPDLKDSIDKRLLDFSNQFYSAIPQTIELRPRPSEGKAQMDAWLKKMCLNNAKILDDKEDLLQLLSDVQGAVSGFATTDIGAKYAEIGCTYDYLDAKDDARRRVEDYMQSSRSRHHDWKCSVVNVWKCGVKGQKDKYVDTMKGVGNIKPLFHGSGPQNILGICKHGLLMRPPGVYITGSMFGNGLYFADQSSKSEQYAFGRYGGGSGKGDSYFMFVADVALGKIKKYQDSQSSLTKPPNGYDSVQGEKGSGLMHNEFIVYSIQQHILQYLVEFRTSSRSY
jgi:poly [ADP-ribose] polymerase